jgi:hypothetical protein|tara:strand:+ start:482 stop:745 length:264 start_codon:yes stop_codon:yes gene_type:complete
MDEHGSSVTLLNRIESHGRKFPWYLEKMSFFLAILGAILVGQWMWSESDWTTSILLPMTVCGLPFVAVISAEFLSRVIQLIHTNRDK